MFSGSRIVCTDFLNRRHNKAIEQGNHAPAKWIEFCRKLLELGYIVHLTEFDIIQTKHIEVRSRRDPMKVFRIRFSPFPMETECISSDFFNFFCGADGGKAEAALEAVLEFYED